MRFQELIKSGESVTIPKLKWEKGRKVYKHLLSEVTVYSQLRHYVQERDGILLECVHGEWQKVL